MTKADATHITLIADRTGSMHEVRSDAEGAINQFLDDQRKLPDQCSLLLVDFDDTEPFRVVHDGPIQEFATYTLNPRGNTPLHDAIGKGIVTTGERLAALPEDERPSSVIFVIQTDGKENASIEYRLDQVRQMIDEQTEKWQWTFVFLASGPTAWDASRAFAGTSLGNNTVRSSGSAQSYVAARAYLSDSVSRVRSKSISADAVFAGGGTLDDDGTLDQGDDRLP